MVAHHVRDSCQAAVRRVADARGEDAESRPGRHVRAHEATQAGGHAGALRARAAGFAGLGRRLRRGGLAAGAQRRPGAASRRRHPVPLPLGRRPPANPRSGAADRGRCHQARSGGGSRGPGSRDPETGDGHGFEGCHGSARGPRGLARRAHSSDPGAGRPSRSAGCHRLARDASLERAGAGRAGAGSGSGSCTPADWHRA